MHVATSDAIICQIVAFHDMGFRFHTVSSLLEGAGYDLQPGDSPRNVSLSFANRGEEKGQSGTKRRLEERRAVEMLLRKSETVFSTRTAPRGIFFLQSSLSLPLPLPLPLPLWPIYVEPLRKENWARRCAGIACRGSKRNESSTSTGATNASMYFHYSPVYSQFILYLYLIYDVSIAIIYAEINVKFTHNVTVQPFCMPRR